jgi:hypothetical protein
MKTAIPNLKVPILVEMGTGKNWFGGALKFRLKSPISIIKMGCQTLVFPFIFFVNNFLSSRNRKLDTFI